jgi:hypothetical protein
LIKEKKKNKTGALSRAAIRPKATWHRCGPLAKMALSAQPGRGVVRVWRGHRAWVTARGAASAGCLVDEV